MTTEYTAKGGKNYSYIAYKCESCCSFMFRNTNYTLLFPSVKTLTMGGDRQTDSSLPKAYYVGWKFEQKTTNNSV